MPVYTAGISASKTPMLAFARPAPETASRMAAWSSSASHRRPGLGYDRTSSTQDIRRASSRCHG